MNYVDVVVLLLLLLFVGVACGGGVSDYNDDGDGYGQLHVSKTVAVKKPADCVQMSVVCETTEESPKAALQTNNGKVAAVTEALSALGLRPKTDYTTGYFSVQPVYTVRRYFQEKIRSEEEQQVISGYTVVSSISVDTKQLSLAGDIIDAVNAAGADRIDSLSFGLRSPSSHRLEVVALAVAAAGEEAAAIAAAAGAKVVGIKSIQSHEDYNSFHGGEAMRFNARGPMMAKAMMDQSTQITEANDIAVSATVSVVYRIDGGGVPSVKERSRENEGEEREEEGGEGEEEDGDGDGVEVGEEEDDGDDHMHHRSRLPHDDTLNRRRRRLP